MKDNTLAFCLIVLACVLYFFYRGDPDLHDLITEYLKVLISRG